MSSPRIVEPLSVLRADEPVVPSPRGDFPAGHGDGRSSSRAARQVVAWIAFALLAGAVFGILLPRLASRRTTATTSDRGNPPTTLTPPPVVTEVTPELTVVPSAGPDLSADVPPTDAAADEAFRLAVEPLAVDYLTARAAARTFCWSLDTHSGDVEQALADSALLARADGLAGVPMDDLFAAGVDAYCPVWIEAFGSRG